MFFEEKGETNMKKYLHLSLLYAICAMAGGVFCREFTKLHAFTGVTALGRVHTHLFLLGMLVFLVVALFAAHQDLTGHKLFQAFLWIYNIGVPLSAGASAAISGVAGIGHILTGTGIILLLVSLKKTAGAGVSP